MIKKNLHKPIDVSYQRIGTCPLTSAQYSFFQMVYVVSGEGTATINGNKTGYRSGSLLLFVPDDKHKLDVREESDLLLIRFNKGFFKENNRNDILNMEALLYYAPHLKGCVLKDKKDELMVKNIIGLVLQEIDYHEQNNYNEQLISFFVNALVTIVVRNISKGNSIAGKPNSDTRIQKLILHLQENISCPSQLKAEAIGEKFGISRNYLSSYFKAQTGETLQSFVTQYKLRLIEHRLRFSDRRINEIADELGFADESHLNKFFKKQKRVSLTGFRKEAMELSFANQSSDAP